MLSVNSTAFKYIPLMLAHTHPSHREFALKANRLSSPLYNICGMPLCSQSLGLPSMLGRMHC